MNNENTLFSIIVPCYNCEKYVTTSIGSILKQSYRNLEVIAVDDGSTDNTLNVLLDLSKKDDRVKAFHKENGGYPTAVNFGLDRINGDYFLMMGSDDELCLDLLDNTYKHINNNKIDMLVYKVRMHWDDGSRDDEIDPSTVFNDYIFFSGLYSDFYKKHKYEASYFGLRDTGKIFKSSLLDSQRYFGNYGFDADGIFSLLFAHKCKNFFVMPIEGFIWHLHRDSLSGRKLSISTHVDRLGNWTNLVKSLKKLPKEELADIDYSYSRIGLGIVGMFEYNARRTFLKYYFLIYRYYFNLRTFWFKKQRFKGFEKKLILNSYFPLSFLVLRTIKRVIKR